jgi:hypothetical protein
VLAVAVTVIEVALIVTLMVTADQDTAGLARDTVFAAVMISVNGIVGLSIVVSALRHNLAVFNPEGTGSALATVMTLATLTLVLPVFTTSQPGPEFSGGQLVFAAIASLAIYALFVFTQTVQHRDFFLPVEDGGTAPDIDHDGHADPPPSHAALVSLGLLVVALVSVVGLAKVESPSIERAVAGLGFPHAFVGVVIALLVLLPESISAVRAAARRRMQISLNLAYGSAMASIGLTIRPSRSRRSGSTDRSSSGSATPRSCSCSCPSSSVCSPSCRAARSRSPAGCTWRSWRRSSSSRSRPDRWRTRAARVHSEPCSRSGRRPPTTGSGSSTRASPCWSRATGS